VLESATYSSPSYHLGEGSPYAHALAPQARTTFVIRSAAFDAYCPESPAPLTVNLEADVSRRPPIRNGIAVLCVFVGFALPTRASATPTGIGEN
jgi:hypothetical protein